MVRLVVDDDLHPSGNPSAVSDPQDPPSEYDGPDELHLGAGAAMQVAGDVGSQTIVYSPSNPVWDDPVLRTNDQPGQQKNKQHGDMVSGLYRPDQPHVEFPGYVRPDFTAGTITDGSIYQSLAFLVRMRRTTGLNPLDKEPFVSSRARPIPFLFSLGSLIRRSEVNGYDPRREGMTIRATAIAAARPALRASPPPRSLDGAIIASESQFSLEQEIPPHPMLGLYPFALELEFWCSTVLDTWYIGDVAQPSTWHNNYTFDADGGTDLIIASGSSTGTPGQVVGKFAQFGTCVGQPLVPMDRVLLSGDQISGYVAIYDSIAGPTGVVDRIVGYGFCDARNVDGNIKQIRFSSGIQAGPLSETSATKVWVAANGVSARLDSTAPPLTREEWEEVISRNHYLAYGPCQQNPTGEITYDPQRLRRGTLLAATLAR
jgi:hypothetical protein